MEKIYKVFKQTYLDQAEKINLIVLILMGFISAVPAIAQQAIQQNNDEYVLWRSANGEVIQLAVDVDDDGDGIDNALEVNGFTYNALDGLQAWNGDVSVKYFKTDPLRWSTDGDPYSDYMEATEINMPSAVPFPERHPLVAARPVIIIGMEDYDVNILGEITNTTGGSLTGSYTNETSQTTEKGGEVSVSGGWSAKDGLSFGASVTGTYSRSNSTTKSSTNGFGSDWNSTRSTNPNEAASLTLRIYMQNLGSAAAREVVPTFNLVIGNKTIATITPNQQAELLAAKGFNESRYPTNSGTIVIEKDNSNNDILLTMDELRAIQLGAPLSLVVTQVSAKVTKWNQELKEYKNLPWADFVGEIDPVVVNLKGNIGEENFDYQVYVGENFNDLGQTFEDVLSLVFNVDKSSGETLIEGRKYPDEWLVSTTSQDVIDKWDSLGRPNNLLDFNMFRNTYMILFSSGSQPEPEVNMAIYGPNLKKVYVSASGGNFPIKSVVAKVTIGGVEREVPLVADENSFFSNEVPFESEAKPNGQVIVTNISDRETVSGIALPALFKNASDIKENSAFIPNPGGEYIVFPNGDSEKMVKLYCQFYELGQDTVLLDIPKNYIPLPQNGDSVNYVDWWLGSQSRLVRAYYSKILLNPDDLELGNFRVEAGDLDWAMGDKPQNWSDPNIQLSFGSIPINGEFQGSAKANIDLTGTPFSIAPETDFVYGNSNVGYSSIHIDESRQLLNVYTNKLDDYTVNATSSVGLTPSTFNLDYKRKVTGVPVAFDDPGRSIQLGEPYEGEGSFANMGNSNEFYLSNQNTLEAWINPTTLPYGRDEYGIIIGKDKSYFLMVATDGTIVLALAADEYSWSVYNTHYKATVNKWDHVAVTFEFNIVKMYINGNLFREFNISGFSEILGDGNSGNFIVGRKKPFYAADDSDNSFYQGLVDEARLWNKSRTQEEIQSTMGSPLELDVYATEESGLIGYWRFDELEDLGVNENHGQIADGSDDVRDYSVNGFHGDLSGEFIGLSDISVVNVKELPQVAPISDYSLHQNYPNPFNPTTRIMYDLPEAGNVKLTIHNIRGERVRTLVNSGQSSGSYQIEWDGSNDSGVRISSGVYFYRLQAGGNVMVRKMLMLK